MGHLRDGSRRGGLTVFELLMRNDPKVFERNEQQIFMGFLLFSWLNELSAQMVLGRNEI